MTVNLSLPGVVHSGLEIEDLHVRYGRATAVSGASLTVPAGAVTALVGPNGAGKSSLALAAYGSIAAAGAVRLNGVPVSSRSATARARAGLAIVPQGRMLFPRLTVRENLQVAAEQLRLPRRSASEALERFPVLAERQRQLAGVLSGGEQQMLAVTRALMGDPKVLLLDELVTGLAPKIVQSLALTVAELARAGLAVLLAAPEIAALRHVVDRGYVMIRGRIVAVTEDGAQSLDAAYQAAMGVTTPVS